jgi:hypothetical protein
MIPESRLRFDALVHEERLARFVGLELRQRIARRRVYEVPAPKTLGIPVHHLGHGLVVRLRPVG